MTMAQPVTEDQAVQVIAGRYGQAVAADFRAWLDKARKKDPKASISALTAAWIVGYVVAANTGKLANFLTGGTAVVTNNGQTVSTSSGTGVPQAAAQAAETAVINNPLAAIGDFFARLTNPHTWLRVGEFAVGGIFLVIGLNALLHNPIGKVAKAVPKVVPI